MSGFADGGQPPMPWLEEAWQAAVAQRGHALLLYGPPQVGQFELGLMLAQTWLCEQPRPVGAADAAQRPCGHCEGCRLLKAGAHPDFRLLVPDSLRASLGLELEAAGESEAAEGTAAGGKGKSAGRDIRVGDVRAAIDWTHQTASRGGLKVLMFHPAHRLNLIAANALLKTLEEPPAPVRVVLTAEDPQLLLPTLRSRCQRLALRVPASEQALAWLEQQGVHGGDILLPAAGGRPQGVLSLIADGVDARLWPEIPGLVRQGRADALTGLPVPRAIDTLQKVCADAMAMRHGARPQYFPPESLPPSASADRLSAWWKRLLVAARHEDHPWNAGLLIESLVLEGRACWPSARPARGSRSAGGRPTAMDA